MHLQYYFGDDFKQFEDYLSSIEHTVFECKKDTPLSGVGAPLDKEYYVLEGMIRTSFIHESGHIKAFACLLYTSILPLSASDQIVKFAMISALDKRPLKRPFPIS